MFFSYWLSRHTHVSLTWQAFLKAIKRFERQICQFFPLFDAMRISGRLLLSSTVLI
jgi:hypothetical protein